MKQTRILHSFRSVILFATLILCLTGKIDAKTKPSVADAALDRAIQALVDRPGGPPGVIVLIQREDQLRIHKAGFADIETDRSPQSNDSMRIASISKAFSGATALSLVSKGVLTLDDDIGTWLPDLPSSWHQITLRQLLNHTSGLPDFSANEAFIDAVIGSFTVALPPRALLDFVKDEPLLFVPGTKYHYSNSDNVAVGLMVESATGSSYEEALSTEVTGPLQLFKTHLPAGTEISSPYIHGYSLEKKEPLEDVSTLLAAGWAWASGGIISTPAELNRFIRSYIGGELFTANVRNQQFQFVPGGSEPHGPGKNSAGLAVFKYQTQCGTMYGHTGNTFGYTQFAVATRDGSRSATVSINLQRTQESIGRARAVFESLKRVELLAICSALAQ